MNRKVLTITVLSVCTVMLATAAYADLDFDAGRWRLEISGAKGIHSGSRDRTGDFLVTGSVEYEFPATPHTKLGLRMLPLFLYDPDEYATVAGAGFGLSGRLYQHAEEYRGLFAELEASAVLHDDKIVGNSANLNFLTGVGIGYKFRNDLHAAIRYEHISNAGLGHQNAGANTVGLAIGFTF